MTESDFEKQLEWLVEETRAAVAVYDCYEELQKAAQEPHFESAMIADHAFWQVHLGALQNALFAILGRIFDKRKDAHSISRVLDAAEEHIGFFSHEALARRKIAGSPKPPWLDDYMRAAWVGDRQTMADLKKSLEPHIRLYREVYEPLRHRYFAHRAIKPQQSIREMFQQTNRETIGKTIQYLRDVSEALWQSLVNGTKPVPIKASDEIDREEVRSAVRSVLGKLACRATSPL